MGVLNPQTFDFLDGLDIDGSIFLVGTHPKLGGVLSPWKHHWKHTPTCTAKIQMRVGKIKPTPNSRLSSAAMELPSWNRPRMTSDIHWHPVEVGSWLFYPAFSCDFTFFLVASYTGVLVSHISPKKNSKQLPEDVCVFWSASAVQSPVEQRNAVNMDAWGLPAIRRWWFGFTKIWTSKCVTVDPES